MTLFGDGSDHGAQRGIGNIDGERPHPAIQRAT